MEYLTEELYIACFHGKSYNDHHDKFLIGILNGEKKKLKDVITGEIVESFHFTPITRLKWFRDGGNNMALGYMTGLAAADASIRQHILAERINSILTKDVLEEKDIIKIKKIMNKEIIRNYEKKLQKNNLLNEKEKKLQKYSIDESERNF
ncbi:MAG: hypothetical protein E7376_00150 [Clostridiales bacterium]|nr:hypothetical protein [Clostridiales bacterium]